MGESEKETEHGTHRKDGADNVPLDFAGFQCGKSSESRRYRKQYQYADEATQEYELPERIALQ